MQSLRIQPQKTLPTFDELNEINKRGKDLRSVNSLFQGRFRRRRRHRCLSSLLPTFFAITDMIEDFFFHLSVILHVRYLKSLVNVI